MNAFWIKFGLVAVKVVRVIHSALVLRVLVDFFGCSPSLQPAKCRRALAEGMLDPDSLPNSRKWDSLLRVRKRWVEFQKLEKMRVCRSQASTGKTESTLVEWAVQPLGNPFGCTPSRRASIESKKHGFRLARVAPTKFVWKQKPNATCFFFCSHFGKKPRKNRAERAEQNDPVP